MLRNSEVVAEAAIWSFLNLCIFSACRVCSHRWLPQLHTYYMIFFYCYYIIYDSCILLLWLLSLLSLYSRSIFSYCHILCRLFMRREELWIALDTVRSTSQLVVSPQSAQVVRWQSVWRSVSVALGRLWVMRRSWRSWDWWRSCEILWGPTFCVLC